MKQDQVWIQIQDQVDRQVWIQIQYQIETLVYVRQILAKIDNNVCNQVGGQISDKAQNKFK